MYTEKTRNRLYRLPYSRNDNPNAWLEVTTVCNAKCPGCYRGCDLADRQGVHKPVEEIRNEIISLRNIRNCQTVSIAGGEAVLHPDLMSIIRFISEQGLHSLLYTNGKALNQELLVRLKTAGLNGVIIRIDTLQEGIGPNVSEKDLTAERDRFLSMIRAAGGMLSAFTAVVDRKNLADVPDLVRWAERREVGFLVLVAKRDFSATQTDAVIGSFLHFPDIDTCLGTLNKFSFASYLGSDQNHDDVKWAQAFPVILKGMVLGYCDNSFVELMQVWYHLIHRRYCYLERPEKTRFSLITLIFLSFFNKSIRTICTRWFAAAASNPVLLFRRATLTVINCVFPPGYVNGKRDLCDGCPDAMLYKGRLVPSCLLEEIKNGGKNNVEY
jgi:uncharacterized Fe-S cluster-containing radical SAM superfamily protein